MWSENWGELWPVSPSPASSAVFLAALPGPRPRAASRSSARPAARSTCSSWGCPSSDQRCAPSDANKREYSQSTFHHVLHFEKKERKESPTKIKCLSKSHVGAHLPVLFQVSDLLPQLFQAGQSFRLSQLHPNQLLLKTRHIGVIW